MLYILTLVVRIPLRLIVLGVYLPLLLCIHLTGRVNPQAGSQLFLFWLKLAQRIGRTRDKSIDQSGTDFIIGLALLGQGVAWNQIRPLAERCDKHGWRNGLSSAAFHFYVVEGKYEESYQAVLVWCEATEERVAGQEEDMRRFFVERGVDPWGKARASEYEKAVREWQANPQGRQPPGFKSPHQEEARRVARYMGYYKSHLALEIMRWMRSLDPQKMRRAKAAIRANSRRSAAWLYQIDFNEKLARSMGMDKPILNEIRSKLRNGESHSELNRS